MTFLNDYQNLVNTNNIFANKRYPKHAQTILT